MTITVTYKNSKITVCDGNSKEPGSIIWRDQLDHCHETIFVMAEQIIKMEQVNK